MINIWGILGIEETSNIKEVKKAYAKQLKVCHPESSPEEFQRLREAYEEALACIKYEAKEAVYEDIAGVEHSVEVREACEDEEQVGKDTYVWSEKYKIFEDLIGQIKNLYEDIDARNDIQRWEALMKAETLWNLEDRELFGFKLQEYLIENSKLTVEVWSLLDDYFHWSKLDEPFSSLPRQDIGRAVSYGDPAIVRCLLENGVNIETLYDEGMTPLLLAAAQGNLDIVKMLVEYGANIKAVDTYERKTSVIWAVNNQHREVLQFLIDNGGDIEARQEANWTPLMYAAYDGSLELVQCLVENGAKVNAVRNQVDTALDYAALHGHREIVLYLLKHGADKRRLNLIYASSIGLLDRVKYLIEEKGADIEKRTSVEGYTALYIAAKKRHKEVVKYLLDKGAFANTEDILDMSPLLAAARNLDTEMMDILLENGADLEYKTGFSRYTPLIWCVLWESYKAIDYLLERGANINVEDYFGHTTLMIAAREGKLKLMKYLLERGVEINTLDHFGSDAQHSAVKENQPEALELLWERGANSGLRDMWGKNLLLAAAYSGQVEMMMYLEKKGFSLIECDAKGNTPLLIAVDQGQLDVVKYMLKKGCDINEKNIEGRTALMLAAIDNNMTIIKFLIQNGAEVQRKDSQGKTTLMLAAKNNSISATKYLLDNGGDINELNIMLLSCVGMTDRVKLLVENENADIEYADENGCTALLSAVKSNNIELVKYLIKKGADIEARDQRFDGKTALHLAARRGYHEIVKLLLQKKANLEERDNLGRTVLMSALELGKAKTSKYLIRKGAELEATDKEGNTALMVIVIEGNNELVSHVVKKGALINKTNQDGSTALILAVKDEQLANVKLLINSGADVNMKDKQNKTALDYAKEKHLLNIIHYLSNLPV